MAALAAMLAVAAAPAAAQAEDNLLHGPHPFLKENEVSARMMIANGIGDSFGGTKLALGYGYKWVDTTWLNLQMNLQFGHCSGDTACGKGRVFETMGGLTWKMATSAPVVLHANAVAGFIFVFPDDARSALGLAIRGGGGATYFLYDWLGLGIEMNLSLGRASYEASYPRSANYAVLDFGGGVQFQFAAF